MKNYLLILFILFFTSTLTFGQKPTSVETIRTEDKIFTGQINDKYDITIYLKYNYPSEGHLYIYSVKGWYYYNSVKKSIPVVGIYDGDLILYVFKSQQKEDSLLNLRKEGLDFWEKVDYFKNLKGYEEKFIINGRDESKPNEWLCGAKKLKLSIDTKQLSILDIKEYLRFNDSQNSKTIRFIDLGIYDQNLKVLNINEGKEELKVLLEFNYISRPYALGMCGAGFEKGYIMLKFDSHYNLVEIQRVLTESCLEGIYSEGNSDNNDELRKYKITDREGKTSILTINLKEIKMIVEK